MALRTIGRSVLKKTFWGSCLLLVVLAWAFLNFGLPGQSQPRVVLVVGDFSRRHEFAEAVYSAVEEASIRYPIDGVSIERFDDSADLASTSSQHRLLGRLARRKVVAIIAASTSPQAPTVHRVASALQVPTIYTVATAPQVLQPVSPFAFRFVPRDNFQAATIADQAIRLIPDKKRIAIVHSTDLYGLTLSSLIAARVPDSLLIPMVDRSLQPSAILDAVQNFGITGFCVVAYSAEAHQALLTIDAYARVNERRAVPVILSDSAFDLFKTRDRYSNLRLFVSVPTSTSAVSRAFLRPTEVVSMDESISSIESSAFRVFGLEAWCALYAARNSLSSKSEVLKILAKPTFEGVTFLETRDGERTDARFTMLSGDGS